MSWHCSRALVEAYSLENSLAGGPSALLNTTLTPETFYWPDKTTEHSRLSRFGMTFVPLMADLGEAMLMWFLADFLVRTSAQPAKAMDLRVSEVGCGRKWLGLLARYDQDSLTWRTPQCSLVVGLDEFSETWPRWGSMRNGECWERTTAVESTSESEFGYLPTPRASMASHGIAWCRARTGKYKGNLEDFLGWKHLMAGGLEISGLNVSPSYCEFLMMWPTGWTDLKPLETGKYHEWQQKHSDYSPKHSCQP